MLESIKFSLARKLKDPKFRNIILREHICQEVLNFIHDQLKINSKNLHSFIEVAFSLKTRTIYLYIKDHRLYTNILLHKLNILNYLQNKFSPDAVKTINILRKFHH